MSQGVESKVTSGFETFDPHDAAIDLMEVKKHATYSVSMSVWLWLKREAEKRGTDASALIADLVKAEQERSAA